MPLREFLQLAHAQGFHIQEKTSEPGVYIATKSGYMDTEAFEIDGHACLVWQQGYSPVQISTRHWTCS